MAKPGEDQGTPENAKKAFEQRKDAKVCYINAQGEWVFGNPNKSFGEVVKTLSRDEETGKITEQSGLRKHSDHIRFDEDEKRALKAAEAKAAASKK